MRILIVEDERDLNEIIGKQLIADGYSVDKCFDGEEAIDILDYTDYDGVVLDIMLPKADGFAVLRSLRNKGKNTPVLFLTARDSIEDRVLGLDSGADDYLVKPFALKELSARIRAMTRHFYGNASNEIVIEDLRLNRESHSVKRGDNNISLSSKEFALLEYLMINKGKVVSRENIENHIWNFDYEGGTNVVDVYIRYLRRKIDEGYDKKLIETVRGRGYVIRDGEK